MHLLNYGGVKMDAKLANAFHKVTIDKDVSPSIVRQVGDRVRSRSLRLDRSIADHRPVLPGHLSQSQRSLLLQPFVHDDGVARD